MQVEAFDFELPDRLIALRPAVPRDAARMLIVRPHDTDTVRDGKVVGLPEELRPDDVLVLNDTRVIPARLRARRERTGSTGANIEIMLHQRLSDNRWRAFARPAKRLKQGDVLRFGGEADVCFADHLDGIVEEIGEAGEVSIAFSLTGAFLDAAVAQYGEMPLPPYIAARRPVDDADLADYQTVYASNDGAVAAPTAGLHFTPNLLQTLNERGISHCFVTLHVGAGTFLPIKVSDTMDHRMHSEWGVISPEVAARLNAARRAGGRIVAVGTTSLRILESAVTASGLISPYSGETSIFITPGYEFSAVDVLFTNFHLPRSTLFMLVSAFCGLETIHTAYRHAIERDYRFYSYGDSCLLFPAS